MKNIFVFGFLLMCSFNIFSQQKKSSTSDSLDIEYKKSSIKFQEKQTGNDSVRLEMEKKSVFFAEEELKLKKQELEVRKEELEVKKIEANVQKSRFDLEKQQYENLEKLKKDKIDLETIKKSTLFMAYPFSLIGGGLDLYLERAISSKNSLRLNIGYFQRTQEENPSYNMTKFELSVNTYMSKTRPVLNDFYWNFNLSYRSIDHTNKQNTWTSNGWTEKKDVQNLNYIAPGLNIGYHYFLKGAVILDVSLGGEFGILTENRKTNPSESLPRIVGVNSFNNGGKIRVNLALGVPL
ncbi:MAG: hypothetical protein SNJ77_03985 [Cytophagales bacterium]